MDIGVGIGEKYGFMSNEGRTDLAPVFVVWNIASRSRFRVITGLESMDFRFAGCSLSRRGELNNSLMD